MKYGANKKNIYLGRKQQYKQIVKIQNCVTSREKYAKVAYFISVTIQHRCRKYNSLQRNQEHCKWDIWMNAGNINNTVCADDLVWISLTGAEFRNFLWTTSVRIAEEQKKNVKETMAIAWKKCKLNKNKNETPRSCRTGWIGFSFKGLL